VIFSWSDLLYQRQEQERREDDGEEKAIIFVQNPDLEFLSIQLIVFQRKKYMYKKERKNPRISSFRFVS